MNPNNPQANPAPRSIHQILDRQHGGVVACVFEHPASWQARSELIWNVQNINAPVVCRAQAINPQGMEAIEFFNNDCFFHIQGFGGFYKQGQDIQGSTCLPPMSAADAVVKVLIPRYRGKIPGLKILGAGAIPNLIQWYAMSTYGVPAQGAGARFEYNLNGVPVEEEILCMKYSTDVPSYGPMGVIVQTNWGFLRPVAFRAPKGRLDAMREAFWQIVRSFRINPEWERLRDGVFAQIKQQFDYNMQLGYDQIAAAGRISQSISANNDAMLRGFEQQRQAAHRSSVMPSQRSPTDGFDEAIRGVETMNDPQYGESQQDANYSYHWTDGFGNYQHSNDPFFNPNIGGPQSWSIMERKQP